MNIFLKAKHWQLFLLHFAIPFMMYFLGMIAMIAFLASQNIHMPYYGLTFMPYFIIIGLIAAVVQYGWMWASGILLNKRLPEELRMNTTFFKVCFFYPILYLPVFLIVFMVYVLSIPPEPIAFPFVFLAFIPFHMFAVFCQFYCYYFIARVIKTNEMGTHTTINDYIAEIFMIWFFFIGIWFMQPKINKMVSGPDNQ